MVTQIIRFDINNSFKKYPHLIEKYQSVSLKNMQKKAIPTVLPQTVFHFTRKDNITAIKQKGLQAGCDGGVYVSTSFEENYKHLRKVYIECTHIMDPFTNVLSKNTERIEDYIIIEFEPEEKCKCEANWRIVDTDKDVNQATLFYIGNLKGKIVNIYQPK